jgi:hypothetical protein
VFVIRDPYEEKVTLPISEADHLIKYLPKQPESKGDKIQPIGRSMNEDNNANAMEDEDAQLQEALLLSMGPNSSTTNTLSSKGPLTKEQMREARLAKIG